MQYAPLPTEEQLERVREAIGAGSLAHSHRLESGLSCTMDVLREGSTRMILRRYDPPGESTKVDGVERETRALELLQRANIPAPAPIWADREGVFGEPALLISYVDGSPDLTPSNPFDWAEQLAGTLARIHDLRLDERDAELFRLAGDEEMDWIQENLEDVLEHPLGEELLRRRVALGQREGDADSVFIHADYWPGNTLWSDGDLTAVIDWESPCTGDRAMDVAYCSLDIRYLGMDKVAERFVAAYREASGDPLPNLALWEAVGLCRPMPDIAIWVPAWTAMGRPMTEDQARDRYSDILSSFLQRTA
jgi:aminoglycoside phosphotransferase (APT) family kinase protein